MYLQEIFDSLTYGELSQLSIGGGADGAIDEANYPRVLNHINLGLADLYKRFPIKQSRILLELVAGRFDYPLTSKFARANTKSREVTRYLVDSSTAPFKDDIIKVERVLTEDGVEMALNIEGDKYSVFTPTSTMLTIHQDIIEMSSDLPEELKTSRLELVYRAGHPKIVVGLGLFDPERVEVQLPDTYLQALLLFVASRAHNPVGMTGEFNAGNNYAMKYEAECQSLTEKGVSAAMDSHDPHQFHAKGWV